MRIGAGHYSDPYFYWARIMEIDEGGALLVRPDGVVAWRKKDAVSIQQEVTLQLAAALDAVLGRAAVKRSADAIGAVA